jgi:hypothetical protein
MKTRPIQVLKNQLAPREEVVQSHIIGALRSMGLRVLQTTHRVKRQRCPHCGEVSRPAAASYGASPGVPDILATADDYPPGTLIGLEVKSSSGTLSREQKELKEAKRIHVVRSIEEAEKAIEETEQWLLK